MTYSYNRAHCTFITHDFGNDILHAAP